VSATNPTTPVPNAWDSAALRTKAQRYIEEMQEHSHSDWKSVLWSSLALELLARAALSNVSPVLLPMRQAGITSLTPLGTLPR
jgi:hypothetical protein